MGLNVSKVIGTDVIYDGHGKIINAIFLGNKLTEARKHYPKTSDSTTHPVAIIDDAFSSFNGMCEAELAIAFGPTRSDHAKFLEAQGRALGKLVILPEKNLENAADVVLEHCTACTDM
jgi:hypothetical protein